MLSITFYTDELPDHVAGRTNGPIIRIKKGYEFDIGLHQHELVHVKQWWTTLGLHSLFYNFFDSYKLKCEVAAYKEQAKHYNDDRLPLFAEFISKYYSLNITKEEAYNLLTK